MDYFYTPDMDKPRWNCPKCGGTNTAVVNDYGVNCVDCECDDCGAFWEEIDYTWRTADSYGKMVERK